MVRGGWRRGRVSGDTRSGGSSPRARALPACGRARRAPAGGCSWRELTRGHLKKQRCSSGTDHFQFSLPAICLEGEIKGNLGKMLSAKGRRWAEGVR